MNLDTMTIPALIKAVQYVAIAILFFELIFALAQRPSELQKHVCMMVAAAIVMFVGYNIELDAINLGEAVIGAATSYMGKPYVLLFSFTFICTFYDIKVSNKVLVPIALYCALFCVLVFWNDSHYLYYASTAYVSTGTYSPLVITPGPLYYLYIVSIIVYFVACSAAVVYGSRRTKSIEKLKLSNWIILMLLCGIVGYIFYLSGKTNGYDSTMLGVFGGVVCLFILFTRYRIFSTVMMAQETALLKSSKGLIVLDTMEEPIYINNAAKELLEYVEMEKLISLRSDISNLPVNDKVYEIIKTDIIVDGTYYGKSIEANDITISYNYQTLLEHDIKERTEQIENIQREVIGSIASIVEARSFETGEHIKRTKQYVEATAKALREKGKYTNILTDKYINLLVNAAPLHDIGKISIPDRVLYKPEKLNEEEFEEMKLHSTIGSKIVESTMRGLENDDYVDLAYEVALYHHEWWDGSGYPSGLKGNEIPLSARIVGIADTYDALISVRCYKKAYSKEKAIKIIKEETGTHFDPDIAEAFLSTIE